MNRLRAPASSIGLPKVTIAAREMFEFDPFLDIQLWPEGLTQTSVDDFLNGSPTADGWGSRKLDLLVEECDDLFMKVLLRERAKTFHIPVVMETNERGMVDVERFDLDPARPILHGLLDGIEANDIKSLPTYEKIPYVLRIIVGDNAPSPRFVPSLMEINETIGSWPQLASGVCLGAALVTDVTRRILLDQFRESGRFFVDLDQLICEGRQVPLADLAPLDVEISPLALQTTELKVPHASETPEQIARGLIEHALRAPSGGNTQPWRFVVCNSSIRCLANVSKKTLLDSKHNATYVSVGAAVMNMELAARAAGLSYMLRPIFDSISQDFDLVCSLSINGVQDAGHRSECVDEHIDTNLVHQVAKRVTNRNLGQRQPIAETDLETLQREASDTGAHLQVVSSAQALDEIGAIVGKSDRMRFLSKRMHDELMSEICWTRGEVESRREGIDLATLVSTRSDVAGIRLTRKWENIRFLREIGGGKGLEKLAKKWVDAASAVALLTMPGTGPSSFFEGGRAMQRVWLRATALGLGFQPITSFLYFPTLDGGQAGGFTTTEASELRQLRLRLSNVFDLDSQRAEVLLFRLADAEMPRVRSLRKSVDDVTEFLQE